MKTHGLRYTKLYKIWAWIKGRTNPNSKSCNRNYRKLGIKMCDEWKNDFKTFYDWAMANGYKEEMLPNGKNKWTIDRIDTYGDYTPDNCRWITNKEQMNNQTTNKKITYNGKTQSLAQWCEELGLNYGLVNQRLWMGWNIDRAFNESPDKKKYYEYNGALLTKKDISKITGMSIGNIENRLHRKWSIERIMTQPENPNKKGDNKNV